MHILMVAAENDALPGGKVGGLGDVIRDLPIELGKQKQQISVVTPGYGMLAHKKNSILVTKIDFPFSDKTETVSIYRINDEFSSNNVTQYVFEHWIFSAGGAGNIYSSDHYGPFATDAYKFSLFSAAACESVLQNIIPKVEVLHCHDWHSTTALILRSFSDRYAPLKEINSVFTIHNLSIQGIRPFDNDESSLRSWFPNLSLNENLIADPNHSGCMNFMRAGINLADKVNTVSKTYAEEILQPSNWDTGFIGGEGLEKDLIKAKKENRLFGIINGIDYSKKTSKSTPNKSQLCMMIDQCIQDWALQSNEKSLSYYFALRHLQQWQRKRKKSEPIMISIGRMTKQKLGLLTEHYSEDGNSNQSQYVIDRILSLLKNGIYIMLGSGDTEYDVFFTKIMKSHNNFIYLNGYSGSLPPKLYEFGDIFMMPSLFEPCGISQMLAMREGMPCIGHDIGGLSDTITPKKNGFLFSGNNLQEKANNLMATTQEALDIFEKDKKKWEALSDNAKAARFAWDDSATSYINLLYKPKSCAVKTKVIV
ncbi:MAG: glycogen/starch synthase [Cellvibrionaceae bacterium]